jgi:hypothetical protein
VLLVLHVLRGGGLTCVASILLAAPATAQSDGRYVWPNRPPLEQWLAQRSKGWQPRLRRAGLPKNGMILETWLAPPVPCGNGLDLVVSYKNISERPIVFPFIGQGMPDVVVLDERGELAQMTPEGIRLYRDLFPKGSHRDAPLLPGCAKGMVVDIRNHFALSAGLYTVFASDWLPSSSIVPKVAAPLALRVGDPHTPQSTEWHRVPSCPKGNLSEIHSTDPEWRRLLPHAGKEQRGRTLVTIVSPEAIEKLSLVVSLTCVEPWAKEDYRRRQRTPGATDFRVLIHDSKGKAIPVSAGAWASLVERNGSTEPRFGYLAPGDAAGLVVPLAECFNLVQHCEYTGREKGISPISGTND